MEECADNLKNNSRLALAIEAWSMKFTDIVAFSILTFTVATAVAVAQPAPGGIARTAPGPMMGDVSVPFEWLIRALCI